MTDWIEEGKKAPAFTLAAHDGSKVKLTDFIEAIEAELGIAAKRELLPMQPGDVAATYASTGFARSRTKPARPIPYRSQYYTTWNRERSSGFP